jgi:flagellar biosynthetic protein FliR
MNEITFSLQQLEFFLIILVRLSGFVFTAPFFSLKNSPRSTKIGLSLMLSLILFQVTPYEPLEYMGVVGYAIVVVENLLAGVLLGFLANVSYQILSLAGHMMDMQIGFSMVNEFDPVTSTQVTVSGVVYEYAVMLVLMVTYMHHYLLDALIDSFTVVPVGGVIINPLIYNVGLKYLVDFFVIAFRIVLPVFAALLIVNAILAIMAKVAPQMNMFVIGMQLKVFVGMAVMLIVMQLIPTVGELIFDEMFDLMRTAVSYFEPG